MFPEALSIEIATQANKYAWKHANKNWYPTNPEEMKALIAQYWYSNCHGCSTIPAQEMYWYKDTVKIIKNKTQ